jgi:hypothetical protein
MDIVITVGIIVFIITAVTISLLKKDKPSNTNTNSGGGTIDLGGVGERPKENIK